MRTRTSAVADTHRLLAAVTCATLLVTAGPSAAAPPVARHEELPNGLRVLLLPQPGRPVASVQLIYGVGPVDEDAATVGYAHLFKHLMFTGTEAAPVFAERIAELSGRSRSDIEDDLTIFETDVPATAVEAVIALEADRMRGLALTAEALDRALAEVRAEQVPLSVRAMSVDDIVAMLRPVMFAGHPYAHVPEETIPEGATVERCRAFYDQHYRPDRACIVVAGGINPDRVLEAIRTHFGSSQPIGDPRRPLPALPESAAAGRPHRWVETTGPTHVAVGYRMPRRGEPDWASVKLLTAYLNRSASRLRAALSEAGQQVAWVAAGYDETSGLLGIVARLGPGTDPEAVLERLAPLADRATESIDPQVFADVRDRLRLSEASRISSVSSRASALGREHFRRGDYSTYDDDQRALATGEPLDVAGLAASHLDPDCAVTLIVGPATAGRASTTGGLTPSASGQSEPSTTGSKEAQ